MSANVNRIFYKMPNEELWTKILEYSDGDPNGNTNRIKVTEALNRMGYQYQVIDPSNRITSENGIEHSINTEQCPGGASNDPLCTESVKTVLFYLNEFKHFIKADDFVSLESLVFTNNSRDLIQVIKAYDKYTNETVIAKNDMAYFIKVLENDHKLMVAYLFFEYTIDRIENGRFSRYPYIEIKEFFSTETNRQILSHKKMILSALVRSALKLYRSNQISFSSKLNLLPYADYSNVIALIERFNHPDFRSSTRSFAEENSNIFKELNLSDEQKKALLFAANEHLNTEKIIKNNIVFNKNQELDAILSKTNESSVTSAVVKYDELVRSDQSKRKTKTIAMSVVIALMMIVLSIIAYEINESRYTIVSVNAENINAFLVFNPSITEAEYYVESSIVPSKYVYIVEMNETYLTDYVVRPQLTIAYTNVDRSIEKPLASLTFETTKKIFDVTIFVSPDYQEDVRVLKSDLESFDFTINTPDQHRLDVIPNDYHFEEISLSRENYSSYIDVIVNAPVDHLKNGLYQNTTYSISISKLTHTDTILQATIVVRYDLSSTQFSSNITPHTVTFQLDRTTQSDGFGRYPFYEYEIQSVTGKIIIRSTSPS